MGSRGADSEPEQKARPPWPPGLGPGELLDGKYRLVRVLGSGGMGAVVAAEHVLLGEPVAIKFPHPELTSREETARRFLREARSAFTVRSPHVVRVLDFGRAPGGTPYIVMEYLDGVSVAELVLRGVTRAPEVATAILLQAAEGVAAAHAKGVIHRDLKPSNLFAVTASRETTKIQVLDFGLATAASRDEAESGITKSGAVLGSTAYMSPEQLQGVDVDERSDVWSLGAVYYELLTGRRSFSAPTDVALIAKILTEPPSTFTDAEAVPPQVREIVRRCLEKHPEDRFQSVDELRLAAAPFARELALDVSAAPRTDDARARSRTATDTSSSLFAGLSAASSSVVKRPSVRRGPVIALGVATASGALLLVALWTPSRPPTRTAASAAPTTAALEVTPAVRVPTIPVAMPIPTSSVEPLPPPAAAPVPTAAAAPASVRPVPTVQNPSQRGDPLRRAMETRR
ncbi:MAG TPA: serine/threonine-protein kinase [Polyangiaceae bacterium]|nr:serine/threonine-protein kinase [Polyangiaceae bacterium]